MFIWEHLKSLRNCGKLKNIVPEAWHDAPRRTDRRNKRNPLRLKQDRYNLSMIKEYFQQNAHLTDDFEIKRAVARGRWYVRNEITGVIKLKKYRTMKQRYYDD